MAAAAKKTAAAAATNSGGAPTMQEIASMRACGLTVRMVRITPELAKAMLERNTANRNIRQGTVNRYVRAMKEGRWYLAGDPVRVGADGVIYDGQHRLWAVMLSGVTIENLLIEGVSHEARRVIDTGDGRNTPDLLKMLDGVGNGRFLASMATWHRDLMRGAVPSGAARRASGSLTYDEVQWYRAAYADSLAWAAEAFAGKHGRRMLMAPIAAAFLFAWPTEPEAVGVALAGYMSGLDMSEGDPMYTLRESVMHAGPHGAIGSGSDRMTVARKALRAVQLAVSGKTLARAQDSAEGIAYFRRWHVAYHRRAPGGPIPGAFRELATPAANDGESDEPAAERISRVVAARRAPAPQPATTAAAATPRPVPPPVVAVPPQQPAASPPQRPGPAPAFEPKPTRANLTAAVDGGRRPVLLVGGIPERKREAALAAELGGEGCLQWVELYRERDGGLARACEGLRRGRAAALVIGDRFMLNASIKALFDAARDGGVPATLGGKLGTGAVAAALDALDGRLAGNTTATKHAAAR